VRARPHASSLSESASRRQALLAELGKPFLSPPLRPATLPVPFPRGLFHRSAPSLAAAPASSSDSSAPPSPPLKVTQVPEPVLTLIMTGDLKIVRASDEALGLLGQHPSQLTGTHMSAAVHPSDRPRFTELVRSFYNRLADLSSMNNPAVRFPMEEVYGGLDPRVLSKNASNWPEDDLADNLHLALNGPARLFTVSLRLGGSGRVDARTPATWLTACIVAEIRNFSLRIS